MTRWILVALLVGCGGSTVASRGSLDQARAYERGTGSARDYRAAAELYRTACDNGRGELTACRALIRAELHVRGVDGPPQAARALADAVCLARREPYACVASAVLAEHHGIAQPLRDAIADATGDLAPCDAAHPGACAARLLVPLDDWDAPVLRRRSELRLQACRAGIVDGCREVVQPGATSEPREVDEAGRLLQAACDAHDADACGAAPGRTPVPLAERCAASDYEACAQLGCQGNAAAKQRAASHQVDVTRCERFDDPSRELTESIAKLTRLRDEMCTCYDPGCKERVTAEMAKWGQQQTAKGMPHKQRYGEAATRRITGLVDEISKCMRSTFTPSP